MNRMEKLRELRFLGALLSIIYLEILAKDPDTRKELFKVLKAFHYQLMGIKEERSYYRIRLMRA